MAVYVDDARVYDEVTEGGRVFRGRFSNLVADSAAELAEVCRAVQATGRGWG